MNPVWETGGRRIRINALQEWAFRPAGSLADDRLAGRKQAEQETGHGMGADAITLREFGNQLDSAFIVRFGRMVLAGELR